MFDDVSDISDEDAKGDSSSESSETEELLSEQELNDWQDKQSDARFKQKIIELVKSGSLFVYTAKEKQEKCAAQRSCEAGYLVLSYTGIDGLRLVAEDDLADYV